MVCASVRNSEVTEILAAASTGMMSGGDEDDGDDGDVDSEAGVDADVFAPVRKSQSTAAGGLDEGIGKSPRSRSSDASTGSHDGLVTDVRKKAST